MMKSELPGETGRQVCGSWSEEFIRCVFGN